MNGSLRKKVIEISFDSETCKISVSAPSANLVTPETKAICYGIGISKWFNDKSVWALAASADKLNESHIKSDEYISFWGIDSATKAIDYIDALLDLYDEINIHIFNRTYDLSYVRSLLLKKYGNASLDNAKKERGEVIYERFTIGRKKIIIRDPYTLTRSSLRELSEVFDGFQKQEIESYDKWMKFNDDGTIEGYWYFKDISYKWEKGIPLAIEEPIWVPWEGDIKAKEENYLFYDVALIKLIHINNQRIKYSLLKRLEEQEKIKVEKADRKRLFKGINTVGNLYIWLANQFFWINPETPKLLEKLDIKMERVKSGEVFNTYRALFQPPMELFDKDIFRDEERSFLGGFTSGSWDYKWDASDEYPIAVSLDINSEYPFIMSKEMPYGELLDYPPKDTPYIEVYICKLKKAGKDILLPTWKDKYRFLKQGILGDSPVEKYLFAEKMGDNPYFYLYPRYYGLIELMCNNAPLIEFVKYKRISPLLTKVIDFLQVGKKDGSAYKKLDKKDPRVNRLKLQYDATKRTLNSGYGKSCEKPKEGTTKWDPIRGEDILAEVWYQERNKAYAANEPFDILSGSYIPMNGRAMILEAIIAITEAGHKFLYSDTDSLTYAVKKGVDPFKGINIDDTKMGAWKIEAAYTGFIYPLKSKKYYGYMHKGIKPTEYIDKVLGEYLPEGMKPSDIEISKLTYSGIEKGKMKSIHEKAPDLIPILYDINENILVRKASKSCIKGEGGNIIYELDKAINPVSNSSRNHKGERVKLGLDKITGLLVEIEGKWTILRENG